MDELDGRVKEGVLDQAKHLRARVRERITECNDTTQREVMAVAVALQDVSSAASAHIHRLSALVSGLSADGGAGNDAAASTRKQRQAVQSYARTTAQRLDTHASKATAAAGKSKEISTVANTVRTLAQQANMLALNARIESARSVEGGGGFSVIANEMKRLSRAIAEANNVIDRLASELTVAIPNLADEAVAMKLDSLRFEAEITAQIRDAEEASEAFRQKIVAVMAQNDQALTAIVTHSNQGLSHLQFQDVVAQGLSRIDSYFDDTLKEMVRQLGLPPEAAEQAPSHFELGGDKKIDQVRSGEVTFF